MHLLKFLFVFFLVPYLLASPHKSYKIQGFKSLEATLGAGNALTFSVKDQGVLTEEFTGQFYLVGSRVIFKTAYGDKLLVGMESSGVLSICTDSFNDVCEIALGAKRPSSLESDMVSLYSLFFMIRKAERHLERTEESYFNDLDEFVFASPNQQDGGTCLFMATTGAAEILLNQRVNVDQIKYEGDTDLSERFLMNLDHELEQWRTDIIYQFNLEGGALLNRDYRYTMGWYKKETDSDGNRTLNKAEPDSENATYGVYYNWIDEYTEELRPKLRELPEFERTILFADPESDQWNVGIINDDEIIEKIKSELKDKKAPVLVMYNHFAYWHAALVVGYDEDEETSGCPFVKNWTEYMGDKAKKLIDSDDENKVKRGKKYQEYVDRVKDVSSDGALCKNKGVFFVRDSIYTGPDSLIYDYDKSRTGEEAPYSKRIVKRSFDWVKYLGNHVYSIHLKNVN